MSPKLLNTLLVLTSAVLYLAFLQPIYTGDTGLIWTPEHSIRELKTNKAMYQNAFNQVDLVVKSTKKINDDYKALIETGLDEQVMIMLPDTIDPIRLRNEVITIGDKAGVALSSVSIAEDRKDINQNLGAYVVTFNFRGRYPVFKKLVEAFEKNLRLYTVERAAITHLNQKDNEKDRTLSQEEIAELLDMNITFKVRYLKK
jgi:hypothetical protein